MTDLKGETPPQDPSFRRAWTKYQLSTRKTSLSGIAREKGKTRQAASAALSRPYPEMEEAIAAAIGLTPKDVWPERYDGKNEE